ncbi:MAG TPA: formimidoylglutamate deiminase [Pyrinomonadaceae bacterium]|nr:formimidoylglutamate deiminase [Pyrinomonadaceae bacterium]
MKSYRFKALLQNQGWLENATVSLDEAGKISAVSQTENPDSIYIDGYALPGFQNAHSHAFQYAMAGLAERHSGTQEADDFWSWREAMYQLALNISPEQIKTIASMLYAELLRHGWTNVAEFHYVHHNKNGAPYNNLAAMGEALIEAAKDAGIKITLIPIFYQKGGFELPANDRQRRFISPTFDDYLKLFEASAEVCKQYEGAIVAVGIHSMRGVDCADILRTANEAPQDIPFHIHVSEQLKEIEDALAFLGKRPVEWLLDNIELNERFHLVHATHLTGDETERLAKTQANVVLCPSTEGNLGDGIFPLRNYQSFGGKWSIGTDSHVGLNPLEELRILDYGQRLITHKRNTFTDDKTEDSGLYAITKMTVAGRKAMNNFESDFFAVGASFDACVINADAPLLANIKTENLASSIIYSTDTSQIYGTFVAGKLIQKDGNYQQIKEKFTNSMKQFR